ncbi:MAG: AzlC family ABC transporter permease [Erysipelotrichaceae bacterium]
MKYKALKAAFPCTIPVMAGYLVLSISYGFLMSSKGFSFIYPLCMTIFIYAGSMEFLTVELLLLPFDPLNAFFLALMVNARHLFYGISMLDKYKNMGFKKFYLIYAMSDETFSLNCSLNAPEGVDQGWFMFFITLLDQIYWICGALAGSILGSIIHFNTKGIEFVMTALFVVMFIDKLEKERNYISAAIGIAASVLALIILGPSNYLLMAMIIIIICFFYLYRRELNK